MKRSFYIAGVQYRPRNEILTAAKELNEGDVLILEPEPTNKYDPNAVKILTEEGIFLGYVPKKFSSEISAMLQIDENLECIIDIVDPAAIFWEMFKVTIQDIPSEEGEF